MDRRRVLTTLLAGGAAAPLAFDALVREALARDSRTGLRGFRGDVSVNGAPANFHMEIRPGDTFCIPHEVDWMVRPGKRGLRLLHARVPKQSSFT